ncbi:MAG: EAL domain-containing protein [Lachnospiraceae bacterium]|nr:EAL domain-containing protein [Lachnospiraceae bacterium]
MAADITNDVVAYDYCAFVLLLIIVVYYFRTSVHGTYRARIMTLIVAVTIAASVCDATRVRFANLPRVSQSRYFFVNYAYLMFLSFITPLFLMYVIATTDMWHKFSMVTVRAALIAAPLVAFNIILIINFIRPVAFEIGADRLFIKHWGYYMGYIIFLFYMLITAHFVRKNVRPIDHRRHFVLMAPIIAVAMGMVVNVFALHHHVICFAVTICILMLILINRRVEDSVDISTGMHTYKVFAEDMDINFKTGKQMDIILLNIVNYKYALRMVGYDAMIAMMTPVSSEILRIMKRYHAQFMCYYNGDGKFAIELSKRHFAYAHEIADEIGRSIRQNIRLEVADFELAINTCLVNCPDDISDVDSLFMLISDLDLAEADGKVVSASSITDTKEFTMKKEMSTIIDRALTNHYFSVFYQPIYDTKTGKFSSAEALLRLRDPKYGYISPALFIPIAEKSGAIHAIGDFVLEEVIKFIASPDFKPLGVDYIEINLSAMQCLRSDLSNDIISLASKYGVDPAKVNLEITETASGYSQSKLYGNIQALSDYGFTVSLDDFGTGYSNLMRIASLPLDIVKLDRVFVLMEEGGGHHVIIRNLIKMLKEMKLKVLVEGVETKEMLDSFVQMGVDEVQGFYFSKPLTKSAYIRFLNAQTHSA